MLKLLLFSEYIYTFKALCNFLACLGTGFPEGTLFYVSKFNEKEVKTKSELTYKWNRSKNFFCASNFLQAATEFLLYWNKFSLSPPWMKVRLSASLISAHCVLNNFKRVWKDLLFQIVVCGQMCWYFIKAISPFILKFSGESYYLSDLK